MTVQEGREIFYFKVPVFIVDLLIHAATLWLVLKILPLSTVADIDRADAEWGIYVVLALSFSVSISITGMRLHERKIRLRMVFWRALLQTFITYLAMTAMMAFVYKAMPRQVLTVQVFTTLPLITTWHLCANLLVRRLRKWGYNTRNVAIVGADVTALRLYNELNQGRGFTGYNIRGFFTSFTDVELPEDAVLLGKVEDAPIWIERNMPDEVYC